jgi:hypothetical protein
MTLLPLLLQLQAKPAARGYLVAPRLGVLASRVPQIRYPCVGTRVSMAPHCEGGFLAGLPPREVLRHFSSVPWSPPTLKLLLLW